MTFFEWIRGCLLWDARMHCLSQEDGAAMRNRAITGVALQENPKENPSKDRGREV